MTVLRSADEPLRALVVDDEAPARAELVYLLGEDPRIGAVHAAADAAGALKLLAEQDFDVVFCDLRLPGMDGVEFARVLTRFAHSPQLVFVTAYDDRAVDAFEVQAIDYVLKPVGTHRLAEAIRRVVARSAEAPEQDSDEMITVELGGVTRFVRRSAVRFVQAQGDYARLFTAEESHLVRIPLTALADRWGESGFMRIHRSTLVALAHVTELRVVDGRTSIRVGEHELAVSRRHVRALRERLERP